jgi:carbamoyltransferase
MRVITETLQDCSSFRAARDAQKRLTARPDREWCARDARRQGDDRLHILGLNAFHGDAAACLLRDGVLIAAAEEERFRRVKHWAGFPTQAIRYCLDAGGIDAGDIDIVALNQNSRANLPGKIRHVLTLRPSLALLMEKARNRSRRANALELLAAEFPSARIRATLESVEHHLAHLASAFFVSPFDDAVVVSVDGFGDFSSAAWGVGAGGDIGVRERVYFPHSLGVFYQAVTQYLGFPHYGDEYKVMGLAPYGSPTYLEPLRELLRLKNDGRFELDLRFFRHHVARIGFDWSGGAPQIADLFTPELEKLLGPRRAPHEPLNDRHSNIARSTQALYEEAFFNVLNAAHARWPNANVALAGGCAMNSVANGKIRRMTPFRKVYAQAAAGDAGGAVGAALCAARAQGESARNFVMDHAYWGPAFTAEEIEHALAASADAIDAAGLRVARAVTEAELCRRAAEAIAVGKVVGWFQGRMEWGPRALGNRSILGDPRRADMKSILNAKIKRRESFRPFAPSVLAEHVAAWFEEDDDAPFMMQVFQIREDKRALIPAVAHVDGSGRLQTVHRTANPRYHALITVFYEITGAPMVLNTSFNENEPVVCTPQQALDCFLRTNMDMLALGDALILRDG